MNRICSVCRQSDILCNACANAVESGKIKKVDVSLVHALSKIAKEKDFDIDFIETVDTPQRLYVVVDSKYVGRFIGPGGKTIKSISEQVGKPIRLLEKSSGSDREIVEKLIGAPVIGVNKVYDGAESYKVRVNRKYAFGVRPLAPIVGKIIGKKISFAFE